MTYKKEYLGQREELKKAHDSQEDRIEKGFKDLNKKVENMIEGIVKELENKTTPSGWIKWNDFVSYQKMGDIVMLKGASVGRWDLAANTYVTVATLTPELRPTTPLTFPLQTTSTTRYDGMLRVKSDGKVEAYVKGGSTSYWQFAVMYFVK